MKQNQSRYRFEQTVQRIIFRFCSEILVCTIPFRLMAANSNTNDGSARSLQWGLEDQTQVRAICNPVLPLHSNRSNTINTTPLSWCCMY